MGWHPEDLPTVWVALPEQGASVFAILISQFPPTPRRSGAVERQLRMRVGKLPFAYWTEPEGKLLYIMDSAVTTYSTADDPSGSGVIVPVPPCIRALDAAGGATAVTLEVDDRARGTGILKVSADAVRLQLKTSIIAEGAAEELLEYLRSILGGCMVGRVEGGDTSQPHRGRAHGGLALGARRPPAA